MQCDECVGTYDVPSVRFYFCWTHSGISVGKSYSFTHVFQSGFPVILLKTLNMASNVPFISQDVMYL